MPDNEKMLPLRKYYSFTDAVEHLNAEGLKCTHSDLFHFAATGAFEPLIYFKCEWEFTGGVDSFQRGIYELSSDADIDVNTDTDEPYSSCYAFSKGVKDYVYHSDLCLLLLSNYDNDSHDNDGADFHSETISIQGFLGFRPLNDHNFFHTLQQTGKAPVNTLIFSPPFTGTIIKYNNNIPPYIPGHEPPEPYMTFFGRDITINDIFISAYEMEILKHGGRVDSDKCHEGIQNATRKRPANPITSHNDEDPRYKWRQLIRDLIFLNYGDRDMADMPWRKIKELEDDFQSKGLELPSAKTLRRWLKEK